MLSTFAILCFVAAPAFGFLEKGFDVRFDFDSSTYHNTSFMSMPQNITTALEMGWVQMPSSARSGYERLTMWCPEEDYTLCMLFDDTGYIAGSRVALDPNIFVGAIYNWTVSGFSTWNATVDGTTTKYYVIHQYYISAEDLAEPARSRKANRNTSILLQQDLYLETFNGDLLLVPTTLDALLNKTAYVKQGCIPGMGYHYYYNMSESLVCDASTISCWFLLWTDGQLNGVGFTLPGAYTTLTGKMNPFEEPSTAAIIKTSAPNAPDCMVAYADDPGVFTMHLYFVENGYNITC